MPATVVTPVPAHGPPLWVSGAGHALPGEASGRILLVPRRCGPRLASFLHSCNGLVCEAAGLTTHAAILAREALVPCLVGVADVGLLQTADCIYLDVQGSAVLAVWR